MVHVSLRYLGMDGNCAVRHLTVRYNGQETPALDRLSFTLGPTDRCAVVGPAGAGKTSLLHAMSGILSGQPYVDLQGSITLNGEEVLRGISGSAFPLVALLPQDPAVVFSDLAPDVESEMRLTLRQAELPQEQWEERLERTVRACGIGGFSRRHPRSLSGGETQLAALAILLVAGSPVICLDEPCSSLDQERQVELSRLLSATLHDRAIIITETTLTLPVLTCRSIMVLDKGRAIFQGTREQFWEQLSEFAEVVDLGGWAETRDAIGLLSADDFDRLVEGLL